MNSYELMLKLIEYISTLVERPVYQIQEGIIHRAPLPLYTIQEVNSIPISLGSFSEVSEEGVETVSKAYRAMYQVNCSTYRLNTVRPATGLLQELATLLYSLGSKSYMRSNSISLEHVGMPRDIGYNDIEGSKNIYTASMDITCVGVLRLQQTWGTVDTIKQKGVIAIYDTIQ